MEEDYREYRTGQGVPKTGEYMCQSGEKVTFNKDEDFPVCPVSGKETYWKNHEDNK
ncbi:hypothetical protein [Halobacillus ihumii]|uniref:hypothetical protein n=1 Tax=Halobacillus ihumii TaxID=2686092 RepID=UPI001967DE19|nr:hypothetical protein [Halobacillus ihumii]